MPGAAAQSPSSPPEVLPGTSAGGGRHRKGPQPLTTPVSDWEDEDEGGWGDGEDEVKAVTSEIHPASPAIPAALPPTIIRTTSTRLQYDTNTSSAPSTAALPIPSAASASNILRQESLSKGSGPALFLRMPAAAGAPLLASAGSSEALLPCLAVLECEGAHIILDSLQRFINHPQPTPSSSAAEPNNTATPASTQSATGPADSRHHPPHSSLPDEAAAAAGQHPSSHASCPTPSPAHLLLDFCQLLISAEVYSMQHRHPNPSAPGVAHSHPTTNGGRYPWEQAAVAPALQLSHAASALSTSTSLPPSAPGGWDMALRGPVVARAVRARMQLMLSSSAQTAALAQQAPTKTATYASVAADGASLSSSSSSSTGHVVKGMVMVCSESSSGMLSQSQRRSSLMRMWPDMLVLMMCEQTVVRRAVAEYFEAVGCLAGLT
ncbi:MAG: hypothetical protein WDW38_008997 [Sanguina aurantia]